MYSMLSLSGLSILAMFFIFMNAEAQTVNLDPNAPAPSTNPYAPPPVANTAPPPQPQQQQQYYVPPPTVAPNTLQNPTVIQAVPTSAPAAPVDLGTLATILTPLIGGISAWFVKNKRDLEKKDRQSEQEMKSYIDSVVNRMVPMLQNNAIIASQTAKQEVKLKEITDLVMKVMGEEANKITDKPEIRQDNLVQDMVKTQLAAQHYQNQVNSIKVNGNNNNEVSSTNPYATT